MKNKALKLVLVLSLLVSVVSCRQDDEVSDLKSENVNLKNTASGEKTQSKKEILKTNRELRNFNVTNKVNSDSLQTQILNGKANNQQAVEIIDPTKPPERPW